jgi:hypothetical protein
MCGHECGIFGVGMSFLDADDLSSSLLNQFLGHVLSRDDAADLVFRS